MGTEIPAYDVEPGPGLAACETDEGGYAIPITVDGLDFFPPGGVRIRCGVPLPFGLVRNLQQFGHWSNLTERFGWLNSESETQAAVALQYLRTGSRAAFRLYKPALEPDRIHPPDSD